MTTPSVTVHCWWPNWDILALALLHGGPLIGAIVLGLWRAFSWPTLLLAGLGLLAALLYLTYCCVTITPGEVLVLSSGLRKSRYSAPLAEVIIGRWRGRPELQQTDAAIAIFEEEDWDTGTPYVRVQCHGKAIPNDFRPAHFARIEAALTTMLAQRAASAAISPDHPASFLPHP